MEKIESFEQVAIQVSDLKNSILSMNLDNIRHDDELNTKIGKAFGRVSRDMAKVDGGLAAHKKSIADLIKRSNSNQRILGAVVGATIGLVIICRWQEQKINELTKHVNYLSAAKPLQGPKGDKGDPCVCTCGMKEKETK